LGFSYAAETVEGDAVVVLFWEVFDEAVSERFEEFFAACEVGVFFVGDEEFIDDRDWGRGCGDGGVLGCR
jgi:hypothetical protein